MSLIITSSEQSEQYGRLKGAESRTRTQLGVEDQADYKNHFTVPVKIPADAEIAVESVKIHKGALYDIGDNAILYRYFGRIQENNRNLDYGPANASRYVATLDEILSMPVPIRPDPGTYNLSQWADQLNTKFMWGYQSPELWNHDEVVNVVSNASGEPTSLSIEFTQRGSASGSDISASIAAYDWGNPYRFTTAKTNEHQAGLDYIPATKRLIRNEPTTTDDPDFEPEGFNPKLDDLKGCSQLRMAPLGLVHGKCVIHWGNCSNEMRVGFARPQMEYLRGVDRQICNMLPGVQQPKDGTFGTYGNAHFPEFSRDETADAGKRQKYQVDYYDYCAEFNEIGDLEVFHTEYNPHSNTFAKVHLRYWDPTFPYAHVQQSHTSLTMDGYDSFKFETVGDELRLWAHDTTGMTADAYLVSSTNSSIPGRCWNPINECRNALFLKATLGKQNQYVSVETLESHYSGQATYAGEWGYPIYGTYDRENFREIDPDRFRYPIQYNTTGEDMFWMRSGDSYFVTGDDFYSNNRVPKTSAVASRLTGLGTGGAQLPCPIQFDSLSRPYSNDQTFICDTKRPYRLWVEAPTTPYIFDGITGAPEGVNYEHALIVGGVGRSVPAANRIGKTGNNVNSDYMEGKYATNEGLGQANLAPQLGFGELSYLIESTWDGDTPDYVNVPNNLQVMFIGPSSLRFRSSPCFVRLPRLTIQSFNGAKSSVSKIVYQVPKFSNEGRQLGELYFAPGEKTYIRLENTESFLLNNLDIQLVDVGEKVVEDLTGPTIVVFHVRKARN